MAAENDSVVNWGIMSTAEIASKVCPAIQAAHNSTVLSVASRSKEKAAEWAEKHGVEGSYGSYDELLDDERIHAVYIPLPTALKTEWAIKAAEKKKHVLVEKPLPPLEDLSRIVHACQRNGVQFMDGTMWPHSNRTKHIRESVLPSLGEIRRIDAGFTFRAPNDEWLHGGNGRTDKTREPMGCLGDQGWYPISAIMFAKQYELPVKVQALSVRKNRVDTIVGCGAIVIFRDGSWASLDCGCEAAHRSYYQVAAMEHTLYIDDLVGGQGKTGNFQAYFDPFVGSGTYRIDDQSGKETVETVEPCDHVIMMVEDFNKCVRDGVDSYWPTSSLANQTVLDAVFASAEQGCVPITISQTAVYTA